MKMRLLSFAAVLLSAYCFVLSAPSLWAQSSNGTYALVQDLVSSAGGQVGSGNPMSAHTTLGLPAAGLASNSTFRLVGGIDGGRPSAQEPITMMITVSGTVNDPSAMVTINGIPAAVSGTTFTAANVQLTLGPNTITALTTDTLGNAMSKSIAIYLDLPEAQKTPRFPITVQGTVDDPGAAVSINGIPATVASGQFTASVPLVNGVNMLTAATSDGIGNTTTRSIHVFVPPPTALPPMPTVGTVGDPIPSVTTQASIMIGGTKTTDTSIWINGTQVVGLNNQTTWSATLSLVEGDNELAVVAKDATSTPSTSAIVNIVVDNLPPVVTFQPPTKTNLTPAVLRGSTDDRLTTVTVNGLPVTRTKRDFECSIPLTLGANALHLVATSPNGLVTTNNYTVTLGTIPTIQTVQPQDGTKIYTGAATTIQTTATDQENDPIQYQVLLDGVPLGAWSAASSQTWTPATTQTGVHTLSVSVRDGYGGSRTKDVEVFVVRSPVQHP